MNEEENKAMEILKNTRQAWCRILSRYIDKQQKEIEELKNIASEFTNRNIEQFSIGEFNFKVKHFKDNYIHKDKIRELKEKVEKEMISNPYDFSYMINELLEEK